MKLSAILSVSRNMPIAASWAVVLFLASLPAQGAPAAACEPAPAVRAELEKGTGIIKTARLCGTGVSAVQRIKAMMKQVA